MFAKSCPCPGPRHAAHKASKLTATLLLALATAAITPAATKTWNTTSGSLSASGNWSPTGTPATTDETLFDGTVTPAAFIITATGTNLSFGNVIWNNNTSSTIRMDTTGVTSTQLRLTGGGGFTAAIAGGGATNDLIVMGTNATSNTLTISEENPQGGVSLRLRLDASGNFNVVNSGATLRINTIVSESGGVRTLAKTGAGTLELLGVNTYSGGTTINAGTLLVGTAGRLGTGTTTLNGGTLQIGNSSTPLNTGSLTINGGTLAASGASARTLSNNITVGGNFALGGSGQAITLNGTMDLGGATRTVTLGNSATFGGAVSNGGLSLNADSTTRILTLNVANTFAGGVTVNGGTLRANHADALGSGSVSITGGRFDLFGASAGAVNLGSGANFTFSGGTVSFNLGSASDQVVGGGGLFSVTGGTFELDVTGVGFSYVNTYQLFSGFTGNTVTNLSITGYDSVNYLATLSNNGLLSFSAVPEPSSYAALAGFAALGLVALRRRRTTR